MTDILDPLIRDLVEWVAKEPRPYADVMQAWQTSCPRLTIWEDAVDCGYVERRLVEGRTYIFATSAGHKFLNLGRNPGKTVEGC